jgi:hypothetical protein
METAILIVNGGEDPTAGKWIVFCVNKILQNTPGADFKIFVWNNNITDDIVKRFLESNSHILYMEANPEEELGHPHAVPLQRLYSHARQFNPKYIITMDSDAHPIRKGWLEELTGRLGADCVISGVWRDELKKAIKPYVHPSCLCTSVAFIEDKGLRFDGTISGPEDSRQDTLSDFTLKAESLGLGYYKLERSNKNNFHRIMGGIYGDFIYHHGAGTRRNIGFWDEANTRRDRERNKRLSRLALEYLFLDYDNYIGWLRGTQGRQVVFDPDHRPTGTFVPASLLEGLGRSIQEIKTAPLKPFRKIFKGTRSKTKLFYKSEKPFSEADLRPLPEGWNRQGPDFIGVGVPKAGTSWWYSLMLQHPDIVPHRLFSKNSPVSKELHYFQHFMFQPLNDEAGENYKKAFAAPPGCICGEFSTIYMHHPMNIINLNKTCPDTKVIVLLRDPVDRMLSHFNHVMKNRSRALGFQDDDEKMIFFKKYSVYPEAYYFSLYANAVRNLLLWVKRENILFLQYEQCRINPAEEYGRTLEFLAVDPRFSPSRAGEPVNKQSHFYLELTKSQRSALAHDFAGDVAELKKLVPEFDYKLWPEVEIVCESRKDITI